MCGADSLSIVRSIGWNTTGIFRVPMRRERKLVEGHGLGENADDTLVNVETQVVEIADPKKPLTKMVVVIMVIGSIPQRITMLVARVTRQVQGGTAETEMKPPHGVIVKGAFQNFDLVLQNVSYRKV